MQAATPIFELFPELKDMNEAELIQIGTSRPVLMIAMTARTGSSHLCSGLSSVIPFSTKSEILNARDFLKSEKKRLEIQTYGEYLDQYYKNSKDLIIFKTTWIDFKWAKTIFKTMFPNIKIIYLNRLDIEAQAVSLFKATVTNIWHNAKSIRISSEGEKGVGDKFDIPKLCNAIRQIEIEKEAWEMFFFEQRVSPVRINYENFATDLKSAVSFICEQIAIQPENIDKLSSEFGKLSNETNTDWLHRLKAYRYGLQMGAQGNRAGLADAERNPKGGETDPSQASSATPAVPRPARVILGHFAALTDPREGWRVVHPLSEILLLVLCATLSGMEDFVEIRLWGEQRMDFLRRFLPYERGLPTHDTLHDVIDALDADLFKACLSAWMDALHDDEPDVVALDGRTSRRFPARRGAREPLHLVSAWASRQRLVIGQAATDATSSEIAAIPRLLERMDLTGALVTIDAMGTQSAIAETIVRGGGDYLVALKANRPATHTDVVRFFADPATAPQEAPFETVDADDGRIEQRRHTVCHDVAWLLSDRRYSDEPRFPHLAMIAMVETRTERGGTIAHERRYYLSSARLDAKTFAAAVRSHWHIENGLQWVLDVVFNDDLVGLRTGAGLQNMAVVKHMATTLVGAPTDKHSLEVRRKLANLNPDYLERLIRAAAPVT